MSLFSVKTFWHTSVPTNEEFAPNAICVGNVDNAEDCLEKVITGSLSGILRIHFPREEVEASTEDLLLENDLENPILQLSLGRFIPQSDSVALAVLHTRKLSVYYVTYSGGIASSGSYASLNLLYEHQLPFNAFSMAFGPFGGAGNKDLFCIQSMDSNLLFLEHDHVLFSCSLPPKIFSSSGFHELPTSFRFLYYSIFCSGTSRVVVDSHADKESEVNVLVPEWVVSLGDHPVVCLGSKSASQSNVIVCERHIFKLSNRGDILNQVKIDYAPVSAIAFPVVKGEASLVSQANVSFNFLISSASHHLLVYNNDIELLWLSKTPAVGLCLDLITINSVKNFVVSISDDGLINAWFFGTSPSPLANIQPINQDDCDMLERERAKLQHLVNKELDRGKGFKSSSHDVSIDIAVQSYATLASGDIAMTVDSFDSEALAQSFSINSDADDQQSGLIGQGYCKDCIVKVTISSKQVLSNVTVTTAAAAPIICINSVQSFDSLGGPRATPFVLDAVFVCVHGNNDIQLSPSSLKATLAVSYSIKNDGRRNTKSVEFYLPISLVANAVYPIKTNQNFKITLELNQLVDIMEFFSAFMLSADDTGTTDSVAETYKRLYDGRAQSSGVVMSFRLCDATEVSLFQKNSNNPKIRLQSNNIESLFVFVQCLVHFFFKTIPDIAINYCEPLPLNDLFSLIDIHLETRHQFIHNQEELTRKARFFRAIQKRLIVRYKEKDPRNSKVLTYC
ncbi:hypothetical protein GEMRC1_004385 [Eukaryota sp. GEM-RC1]